ncbi:hypothetical protein [Pseudobacteriovorax antillogorgiicola]|uniref:Uncharacterized protein n=1 Tax=Pseudobacteriovorax antillogorgiicola TaxID=1513793 RepID=A0A1Y6CRM0_9BACT|nr:hypothetical protein [Pseudobacteriovorax antillogorgiicola]TCS41796.1 hypothetical protein EDD56_14610 [Pseudobacteriovorax antillogorgiicola]SMF83485.1 hypothetical protein SAMN06296036_14711 [Pseudobacteriovorax antillogorgiicola]
MGAKELTPEANEESKGQNDEIFSFKHILDSFGFKYPQQGEKWQFMFHNEATTYLDKDDFQLFQSQQKGDWVKTKKGVTHWISFRKEAGVGYRFVGVYKQKACSEFASNTESGHC